MYNTELGRFCSEHDNWEELLTHEPYNLKISEDGPYVMFKYNQISSDFSNPMVREARGIIFRKDDFSHPVCWPFMKFGNFSESYAPEIDWSTAFVSEKVDGSLIKVWFDEGHWHVSTNGTIDAFKAELGDIRMPNFGTYFNNTVCDKYYRYFEDFTDNLFTDLTYMFELVGPYNRVVVPYEEPAIYFLGARNKFTGAEFNCSSIVAGALGMGRFKLPYQYPLTSLDDCIRITENFGWDQEGFVVCDAQFNRVKIKSPAYVMAHYARNNNVITRKHLIKIILMNEVEEFICYASDYKDELFKVQGLMNAYHRIGNQLAEACRQTATILLRGDYSRMVKALPVIYHGLLYMNYDRIVTAEEYTSKWNENKWDEYLTEVEKLNKDILEV